MRTLFDYCFHTDPRALSGTQYFEFLPGPYRHQCWLPGSRFIHEYTFCLLEGIFAKHLPHYDHYAFIEVPGTQWPAVLADLDHLHGSLEQASSEALGLPYGATLSLEDWEVDRRALATLIAELTAWLRVTLATHDSISILGL